MNEPLPPQKALHAGFAACVLLIAAAGSVSLAAALTAHFGRLSASLKSGAETAADFSLRLDELRSSTREKLAAIGARPEDLEQLSSPEIAKSLAADACAKIAGPVNGACAPGETPLTSTLSLYEARLTATGPLADIAGLLNETISPPLHLKTLSIRPSASPRAVEISAIIEVAGARASEEAP